MFLWLGVFARKSETCTSNWEQTPVARPKPALWKIQENRGLKLGEYHFCAVMKEAVPLQVVPEPFRLCCTYCYCEKGGIA